MILFFFLSDKSFVFIMAAASRKICTDIGNAVSRRKSLPFPHPSSLVRDDLRKGHSKKLKLGKKQCRAAVGLWGML